jgi:membrane-associated protein
MLPFTEYLPAQFQSLESLIVWGGLAALIIIVFAETGLMVGFFLPGDSLLFTAGFLASTGLFDIRILVLALMLAAILGDQTGYLTGKWMGKKLFDRPDGRFFKKAYVDKTHRFYEKYGASTIVLARFVPIVRTFAPIVAGVGKMHYRTFVTYNVLGGILWVAFMTLAGFWLGRIPIIKENFGVVTIIIIVISFVPLLIELWHAKKEKVI